MKMPDQACQKCREAIRLDAVGALSAEQQSAVEQHLAGCIDCRAYASELRATADGLRHLAAKPVEPSANFRARWTTAIKQADQRGPLAQAVAELIEWSRLIVLRNRRAMSVLAPVWVLIILFKLTAPDVGNVPPTTIARSPVEIYRALKSQERTLMAFDQRAGEPVPAKARVNPPHSSRRPIWPVVFRDESETNPQTSLLS